VLLASATDCPLEQQHAASCWAAQAAGCWPSLQQLLVLLAVGCWQLTLWTPAAARPAPAIGNSKANSIMQGAAGGSTSQSRAGCWAGLGLRLLDQQLTTAQDVQEHGAQVEIRYLHR